MVGNLPIILIEVVMVFGGVLLFGWWQLRSIKRDQAEAPTGRLWQSSGVQPSLESPTMNTSTFAAFEADARAAGFDEVLERQWAADTVLDTHTHAFSVEAVVTQGEMWLSCEGSTRHLTPGGRFTLAHDVPHAERYGPQGATYWVARRNPK